MSTKNTSLWQEKGGEPGTIRQNPAPFLSSLDEGQILVKVGAWAINPADQVYQDGNIPSIKYPLILGEDVAGTVIATASPTNVKFKIGDRVVGMAMGSSLAKSEQGGFQEYVVLYEAMTCPIPKTLSFAEASVFPLCLATSAHGLFSNSILALPVPKIGVAPNSAGASILIWGGSSAVGCNAIQLCKASGLSVITTCSPQNFPFVKKLGADHIFDYRASDVVDQIVACIDDGKCVGIFHASGDATPSFHVSRRSNQALTVATCTFSHASAVTEGVNTKLVFNAGGLAGYQETSQATFDGYFAEALSKGLYQVAPAPEVVSTRGVAGIQEGIDLLRKGVSAKKVVTLAD